MDTIDALKEIAKTAGGTIDKVCLLPGGSGFATMSIPLRKDHWIYAETEAYEPPPMVFKMGAKDRAMVIIGQSDDPNDAGLDSARGVTLTRKGFEDQIRAAGKYAVRSATMNGKDMDFDPDALLQNLLVAFLGYHTEDGLSADDWANPTKFRKS